MYRISSHYDVLVTFDYALTSALIASTAFAHPSVLSEPPSFVRTGYKDDQISGNFNL